MARGRPHSRIDLDAFDTDGARAPPREARPRPRDMPSLAAPGPRLVPVRDHRSIMSWTRAPGEWIPERGEADAFRGLGRPERARARPGRVRNPGRREGPRQPVLPPHLLPASTTPPPPREAPAARREPPPVVSRRGRAPRSARAARGPPATRPWVDGRPVPVTAG